MNIDDVLILSPQSLKMIFLQAKKQRLCDFNKSIFINEYLFSCQTLMGGSIRI
jgi:hypothetical protein